MNKVKAITTIFLTFVIASTLLFSSTQYVFAATVFTDDYETGNYSAWTGTDKCHWEHDGNIFDQGIYR